MLTIIETGVGTLQIDIDSWTTRRDVAATVARELGYREARVADYLAMAAAISSIERARP
jgi:hypothetical protein